jgi:hypothetical protein
MRRRFMGEDFKFQISDFRLSVSTTFCSWRKNPDYYSLFILHFLLFLVSSKVGRTIGKAILTKHVGGIESRHIDVGFAARLRLLIETKIVAAISASGIEENRISVCNAAGIGILRICPEIVVVPRGGLAAFFQQRATDSNIESRIGNGVAQKREFAALIAKNDAVFDHRRLNWEKIEQRTIDGIVGNDHGSIFARTPSVVVCHRGMRHIHLATKQIATRSAAVRQFAVRHLNLGILRVKSVLRHAVKHAVGERERWLRYRCANDHQTNVAVANFGVIDDVRAVSILQIDATPLPWHVGVWRTILVGLTVEPIGAHLHWIFERSERLQMSIDHKVCLAVKIEPRASLERKRGVGSHMQIAKNKIRTLRSEGLVVRYFGIFQNNGILSVAHKFHILRNAIGHKNHGIDVENWHIAVGGIDRYFHKNAKTITPTNFDIFEHFTFRRRNAPIEIVAKIGVGAVAQANGRDDHGLAVAIVDVERQRSRRHIGEERVERERIARKRQRSRRIGSYFVVDASRERRQQKAQNEYFVEIFHRKTRFSTAKLRKKFGVLDKTTIFAKNFVALKSERRKNTMASRKNLKKSIQLIASDLISEAYISHRLIGKMSDEAFADILLRIANLNNGFLARANHPEPGLKAHEYYKKLRQDFDNEVEKIIESLNH